MTSLAGSDLGRYHLLEQIGRGGMASVYKAFDPQEDRLVAIKVLSSDLAGDTRFSRRFRREAELVSQLTHPNIVPVWDYGEVDGHAYLVMPFISVGNLAELLRRRELSLEECTRLLDQVSSALDFAHSHNVVHRDIKPSNILLDEKGNALLTDFGLAQIQDVSVSLTGSAMLGTPSYISPEQARGDPVDGRSDQYSLGIILFELATGYLPFDAETPMAVAIKHIQEPVPRPTQVNPRVPEAVEHVILKATSKDPKYRFKTTGEFNRAFQEALAHAFDPAGHPAPQIELPPPSVTLPLAPAVRVGHRSSRRRRMTSLAALAVLLLVCAWATPSLAALLPHGNSGTPVSVVPTSSDPQLTALAATIHSLSTQMAATDGSGMSDAEMQAAVLLTITALAGTPTPDEEPPTGEATATLTDTTWVPPTPRPSFTPTRTQANPTQTSTVPSSTPTAPPPTETFTFFLAPSDTPTSSPTPTSASTSTWTPPPPPTATADICAGTVLSATGVEGREAHWQLTNQNASVITITGLFINWPSENDHLDKVELRNDVIWDRGDQSPPSDITSGWKNASRSLNPGESAVLDFRFSRDAALVGYSLNVTLNGVCSVGSGQ